MNAPIFVTIVHDGGATTEVQVIGDAWEHAEVRYGIAGVFRISLSTGRGKGPLARWRALDLPELRKAVLETKRRARADRKAVANG